MPPGRVLAGLVAAAAAVAIGIAVVASSGGSADEPAPAAAPREPARLTKAQRVEVRALLEADPRLAEALQGQPIDVAQVGPWSSAEHEFIGASAILRLPRALSYPMMRWPVVDGDPPGDVPYEEHTLEMKVSRATELLVNVDLERRRVVGIDPGGEEATLTPGPSVELQEPSGE